MAKIIRSFLPLLRRSLCTSQSSPPPPSVEKKLEFYSRTLISRMLSGFPPDEVKAELADITQSLEQDRLSNMAQLAPATRDLVGRVEECINYRFQNPRILVGALYHSSHPVCERQIYAELRSHGAETLSLASHQYISSYGAIDGCFSDTKELTEGNNFFGFDAEMIYSLIKRGVTSNYFIAYQAARLGIPDLISSDLDDNKKLAVQNFREGVRKGSFPKSNKHAVQILSEQLKALFGSMSRDWTDFEGCYETLQEIIDIKANPVAMLYKEAKERYIEDLKLHQANLAPPPVRRCPFLQAFNDGTWRALTERHGQGKLISTGATILEAANRARTTSWPS